MFSNRLLIALLLAAPLAHAGSWTYVGTLGKTASVADGLYDVRVTLLDADTSRPRFEPVTVHGVAIKAGTFKVQLELDAALRASAGTTTDSLVIATELSSDGAHFVTVGQSSRFDAANAQLGVCWGAPDNSSTQGSATATTCLLPSDLLTQMGPGGGVYELRKQVIAGGGRLVTGGNYSLTGTVGQSAVALVSGGAYQIAGGFHSAAAGPPFDLIFRSGFDN